MMPLSPFNSVNDIRSQLKELDLTLKKFKKDYKRSRIQNKNGLSST